MNSFVKYLRLLRIGWLDAIEYRTEFFVSVLGWGIRLFIAVFLWYAVAASNNGVIGEYSFTNMMQYFFIVQMLSSFIFARSGFDIAYDIYRGDLANFLLKPINYLVLRFIHEISKNAFRTLVGVLIFGTVLFVFFGGIPLSGWKLPLATLASLGAYILNFCFIAIIAVSSFWITNSTRITFIYFGILTIFSGMLIPIDLFPAPYLPYLQMLPFMYIFYLPAKILHSGQPLADLTRLLVTQWLYIATALLVLIHMYQQGIKRFESVGR